MTDAMPDDDVARCSRCGCTEDAACDGGCFWVPPDISGVMEDVCSSCVDPERLAELGGLTT